MLPCEDGQRWRARYLALKAQLHEAPQVADAVLGPLRPGEDAFERANRWLLDTALAFGATRLRFITLWDGGGGDGPGGTRHMVEAVRRAHGEVRWIDTQYAAQTGRRPRGRERACVLRGGSDWGLTPRPRCCHRSLAGAAMATSSSKKTNKAAATLALRVRSRKAARNHW